MACGGHWPPDNSKLVTKYLNAFSQFIKYIDFNKLHQTLSNASYPMMSNDVHNNKTGTCSVNL
jgi:hypothetical protein